LAMFQSSVVGLATSAGVYHGNYVKALHLAPRLPEVHRAYCVGVGEGVRDGASLAVVQQHSASAAICRCHDLSVIRPSASCYPLLIGSMENTLVEWRGRILACMPVSVRLDTNARIRHPAPKRGCPRCLMPADIAISHRSKEAIKMVVAGLPALWFGFSPHVSFSGLREDCSARNTAR